MNFSVLDILHGRSRSLYDVKDLFFSSVDNISMWSQMFNYFVCLSLKRWFQFNFRKVGTHFARIMALNNWETIANCDVKFSDDVLAASTTCLRKLPITLCNTPCASHVKSIRPKSEPRLGKDTYAWLPTIRTLVNSNLVLTRTKIVLPRISVIHLLQFYPR